MSRYAQDTHQKKDYSFSPACGRGREPFDESMSMKTTCSYFRLLVISGLFMSALVLGSCEPSPASQSIEAIRGVTSHRVRAVWVQDQGGGSDTFARGTNLALAGYDSADGRERVLSSARGNYFKPLFTPDGNQVVFSDFVKNETYVIDWNGKNRRPLGAGVAVDVWQDPATGRVWIYTLDGPHPGGRRATRNPLKRFHLDQPLQRELIWDKTELSWSNIQLSHDGKRAGGLFPWPQAGILDLETRSWQKKARGCWTSLSPDNQYRLWVFDGGPPLPHVFTDSKINRAARS